MITSTMLPLLAISAPSGTGKTTLLKNVIPLLQQHGIRCGLIKHTHHHVKLDKPGKDSDILQKAGACEVMLANEKRWALMTELEEENQWNVYDFAQHMDTSRIDLILVEGFKNENVPKILLYREDNAHTPPDEADNNIIAIACDKPYNSHLPILDINDHRAVSDFIAAWYHQQP
ncbi:MAG: Molybdopterin-guanine dinucleotide biosynthesis adapter protein [Candidatus Erwinia impunctatus]|nr:Molybdopterin-guanine dinucleotide biosynthesis adapter protein [Culicoides impunctatus]